LIRRAGALSHSPLRHVHASDIQARGAAASATDALNHCTPISREFCLQISTWKSSNRGIYSRRVTGSGASAFEDVRAAKVILGHKNSGRDHRANTTDNESETANGDAQRKLGDLLVRVALRAYQRRRRHPAMTGCAAGRTCRRDYRQLSSRTRGILKRNQTAIRKVCAKFLSPHASGPPSECDTEDDRPTFPGLRPAEFSLLEGALLFDLFEEKSTGNRDLRFESRIRRP